MAVTYAPGLIGAVLVGVNFAKAAALALGKPLIPVHHIRGHIAANYIAYPELEPPFLCLVVSGGHTMIVEVKDYTDMNILGTTLDDAAGESFDKVARVLGMPYPGGAALDRAARQGDETKHVLPRSKPGENPYNMSFSGLKNCSFEARVCHAEQVGEELDIPSLCAAFSAAVSDTLVPRAVMALEQTGYRKIAVAGGRCRKFPHPRGHPRGGGEAGCGGLPAAAASVRGQRRHDRRSGVLRVQSGVCGRHEPECLRHQVHSGEAL